MSSRHVSKTSHVKKSSAEKLSFNKLFIDFEADTEGYELNFFGIFCVAAAVILFITGRAVNFDETIKLIINYVSVILAAGNIFKNLLLNFRNRRFFNEAEMVIGAVIFSLIAKLFILCLLIAILYTLLKFAENYLSQKSREKAYEVLKILPDSASIIEEGEIFTRKAKHIMAGDIIRLKKNDIIPVNGRVIEGISTINYSPLTRNSRNITVSPGTELAAGGINTNDTILMESTADYSDSMAQQIYSSFNRIIQKEGREERFLSTVFNYYTPAMLVLCLIFAVIVPLIKKDWSNAFNIGIVFLLAACPLEIVNSVSLIYYNAVEKIFSSGAIIKESSIISKLAGAETFICNKTGVLTEKDYYIAAVSPVGITEDKLLSIINAAESRSEHPIAKAIRYYTDYVGDNNPEYEITEIPGKGVCANTGANIIYVGNAVMLFDHGIKCAVPEGTGCAIHVAVNNNYCGYVLMENRVRADIYNPLEKLRAAGIKSLVLLSSDLRSIVRPIAGSLNFNTVKAELSRENKNSSVEYIENNKNKGSYVIYAGNASDELETASKADICVSLDALKNDDVLARSDISILDETLAPLPDIISCASRAIAGIKADVIESAILRVLAIILVLTSKSAILPVIIIFISSYFAVFNQPEIFTHTAKPKEKPRKKKKVKR